MSILRYLSGNPSLWDKVQKYKATEEQMPEEYQIGHRPLHDDWAILSNTKRIDCAYRVPLPYRIKSGPFHKEWLIFDPSYPLSPGAETKMMEARFDHGVYNLLHVLTDRGDHGLVKYEAFIDGEWIEVFTKYTGLWFGKRLSWYKGLHQDNNVSVLPGGKLRSDLMCWLPEFACSWVKEV